jgi:vacuolar-type H+-ATPase subunit F/Vma7
MGYHIVTNQEVLSGIYLAGMQGKYIVIEEEAQVVREMFRRVAAGQSLKSLKTSCEIR